MATFSEYVEPVPAETKDRFAFTNKMRGLPVGKAFIVEGFSQGNLASRVNQFKIRNPGTSFQTAKLAEGKYQVTRIS